MSEDGSLLDANEDPYEALTRTALAESGLTDQVLPEARAEAGNGLPRLDSLGRAAAAEGPRSGVRVDAPADAPRFGMSE
eukprot:12883057-Alexandrium_andersonii.AAC.1